MIAPGASGDSERRKIRVSLPITIREFSQKAGLMPFKVIADLMDSEVYSTLNDTMAEVSLRAVAEKNGIDLEIQESK